MRTFSLCNKPISLFPHYAGTTCKKVCQKQLLLMALILKSQQLWQVHREETQTLTAEQTLCSLDSSLLIGWDILEVASCSCADIHFTMTVWHIELHVTGSVLLALSPKCPSDLWLCFLPLYRLSCPIPNCFSLLLSSSTSLQMHVCTSLRTRLFFLFLNWVFWCDISSLFLSCSSIIHPDKSASTATSTVLSLH